MKKIAVLQFPGINSEYETARAVREAGMEAQLFRWNGDPENLKNFDGYIIPGGFSYEDRGRAGLIASMDPVIDVIKEQAAQGKPVLGICNGAQILVESGLVPGGEGNSLLLCLARNKQVQNGKLVGTGFYNENIHLRSDAPKNRTAFTLDYEPGELAWAPVAHGEGRFTTQIPDLFETLRKNNQIIFRYCDADGKLDSEFPVNPNGAMNNAAAISNPQGNVLAIMPHPERAFSASMLKIFTSMRKYLEGTPIQGALPPLTIKSPDFAPVPYSHQKNSIEFYVQLIITDNESQTIENALRQKDFDVRIRKWVHYEVAHSENSSQMALAQALAKSGELFNAHKETAEMILDGQSFKKQPGSHYFLVRDREDSTGASKTTKIHHHLGMDYDLQIKHGWVWEVSGEVDMPQLLATNIFANGHAQEIFKL